MSIVGRFRRRPKAAVAHYRRMLQSQSALPPFAAGAKFETLRMYILQTILTFCDSDPCPFFVHSSMLPSDIITP